MLVYLLILPKLSKNRHQETLGTWRMYLIMVIMKAVVIFIELDFASAFQKYMTHMVLCGKIDIKNLPVLGGHS